MCAICSGHNGSTRQDMTTNINKNLLEELIVKAETSERKRINYDLRTTPDDGGQRMLNALIPGTVVPIHRHPMSNETVICLSGKIVEVLYEEDDIAKDFPMGMDAQDVPSGKRFKESARYMLDPSLGNFGCVVPAGVWHTVEVLEPSVIFEAKDGKYGQDGSETLADYEDKGKTPTPSTFSNSLGDLKKNIEYIIGMERQSGNIDTPTPEDIAKILNVSVEEVEQCMKEMSLIERGLNG